MMSRNYRNLLLVALLFTGCAVGAVVLFQRECGPIDTFPRLYSSVQCSPSSSTAALYLRKTKWLCIDGCIEALIQVRDSQDKVVYNERLTTLDLWRDISEVAPQLQCADDTLRVIATDSTFRRELHLAELRSR
jgi:hypothetical protein